MIQPIPLDQCKKRHLYVVLARNFSRAVFDGNTSFIGRRIKFGEAYLYPEEHCDMGAPFGTVKPIQDLGEIPGDIYVDDASLELLVYLTKQQRKDSDGNETTGRRQEHG